MRNLKKFLALVLAVMMTFSLMVTVSAARYDDSAQVSKDYAAAVEVLSALGIFKGYGTTDTFAPKAGITRAEVAALVYRITTGDVSGKLTGQDGYTNFDDVPETHWANGIINYVDNSTLMIGTNNTKGHREFSPYRDVTGYEVLTIILRALGYDETGLYRGADWKTKTSSKARELGITTGISAAVLNNTAPRELVAELLFRAITLPTVRYTPIYGFQLRYLSTDGNASLEAETLPSSDYEPYSLGWMNFGLLSKPVKGVTDRYGRPGDAYIIDGTEKKTNTSTPGVLDCATASSVSEIAAYKGAQKTVETKIVVPDTPVKIYYTAVTECVMAGEVNDGETMENVTMYTNGTSNTNAASASECIVDELHTTSDFLGAQGRTTEVYKTGDDSWTIVFIDTLMGEVTDVKSAVLDTAGHVIEPAKITAKVGTDDFAATIGDIEVKGSYSKGDLILLNTYGQDLVNGATRGNASKSEIAKLPSSPGDFHGASKGNLSTPNDVKTGGGYYPTIDVVGSVTKVPGITVKEMVGPANYKTGLIGTNGVTYPANCVYIASGGSLGSGYLTLSGYFYDKENNEGAGLNNSMIGKTYDLYLDAHNNILGMKPVSTTTSNVGVVVRSWPENFEDESYIKAEVYLMDNTTATLKFLHNATSGNAGATHGETPAYTTVVPDYLKKGTLIAFESYNDTYNVVFAHDNTGITDSVKSNMLVPGVTDTIATGADVTYCGSEAALSHASIGNINNDTKMIVAQYNFKYNEGNKGSDEGGSTATGYKAYTGFKTLPFVQATPGDLQIYTVKDRSGAQYFMVGSKSGKGYYDYDEKPVTKYDKVDESVLILNNTETVTGDTYAVYQVVKNGVKTTITVDKQALNEELDKFAANSKDASAGQLIAPGSTTSDGVWKSYKMTEQVGYKTSTPDGVEFALEIGVTASYGNIASATDVSYSKGVLIASNSGIEYLTVADDVVVTIVNPDRGILTAGTLDSIAVYEGRGSSFAYELNEYGWVKYLYIFEQ